uniref:Uncharacterized protein n=1 Tax=Anguilla anguilla TaxID=7936 RepID=A0A0E9SCQ3_ANGAN
MTTGAMAPFLISVLGLSGQSGHQTGKHCDVLQQLQGQGKCTSRGCVAFNLWPFHQNL